MTSVEFWHVGKLSNDFTQPLPIGAVLANQTQIGVEVSSTEEQEALLNLINPQGMVAFAKYIKPREHSRYIFQLDDRFPSGQYYFSAQWGQEGTLRHIIHPFYYQSSNFQNQRWLVTYAIVLDNTPGLEVRVATPKQYFPFLMVEGLSGMPVERLTTDIWSNWLLFDIGELRSPHPRLAVGYRAWLSLNYMTIPPSTLGQLPANQSKGSFTDITEQYLIHEQGIETNDRFVRLFGERITAESLYGKIHQILLAIHQHLRFQLQQGEFGAKYAVLNRQGDCTEYAALFVALCRVKKVPSRLVAGLKRIGNDWIRHAWGEFFAGGLWIPVDVVEGYVGGNSPNLIPLFRGNWMTENMAREVKFEVTDGYNLSTTDLAKALSSMELQLKVTSTSQAAAQQPKVDHTTPLVRIELEFPTEVISGSNHELKVRGYPQKGKNNLIVYFKPLVETSGVFLPKTIAFVGSAEELVEGEENDGYAYVEVSITTPEPPADYELGVFVGSLYGEMIAWDTIMTRVVPLEVRKGD